MEARLHFKREDGISDFVVVQSGSLEQAKKDYLGKTFVKHYALHGKDFKCLCNGVEELQDDAKD